MGPNSRMLLQHPRKSERDACHRQAVWGLWLVGAMMPAPALNGESALGWCIGLANE